MGLQNDVSRPDWVVAAPLAGGTQAPPQGLLGLINASITVTYTATVAASSTFSLQTSDFGNAASGGYPTAGQWTTLPGSTQAVPGTASPIGWQLQNIGAKWIRIVFTDGGASTGTYSAAFTGRGTT